MPLSEPCYFIERLKPTSSSSRNGKILRLEGLLDWHHTLRRSRPPSLGRLQCWTLPSLADTNAGCESEDGALRRPARHHVASADTHIDTLRRFSRSRALSSRFCGVVSEGS